MWYACLSSCSSDTKCVLFEDMLRAQSISSDSDVHYQSSCVQLGAQRTREGSNVLPPGSMSDPGEQRPASAPLRVGHDRELDEYVEFWFQVDKAKDPRVLTLPQKRNGGEFGWGYMMRRSRGACIDKDNQRLLVKIHLCHNWPCPSDFQKT